MSIYKRGSTYWYEFVFEGRRVRKSTKQGNKNVARNIESTHRTALAKGEAGIKDHAKTPTVAGVAPRFEKAIETLCGDKPQTVRFYKSKLRLMLTYEPLRGCWLDRVRHVLRLGGPVRSEFCSH